MNMDYIYFRFYRYSIENGNYAGPEFTACMYVSLFLLLHLLILSLLLAHLGIANAFQESNENLVIGNAILLMGLVYLYYYYKKRYLKIIDKYNSVKDSKTSNVIFECYIGILIIIVFILLVL
jgi:hypothetical protein